MRRKTNGARLASAGLLALSVAVVPGRAPASAAPCDAPEQVAGIGLACRVPGGFLMLTADGSRYITHGLDHLPAGPALAGTGERRHPQCARKASQEFHNEILYVRASDMPDRYDEMENEIRRMVARANGMLYANANLFDHKLDLRFQCDDDGDVVVHDVALPTSAEETTTFDSIITGVRVRGFTSTLAKYWMWYDGRPGGVQGANGVGTINYDDRLMPENRNNVGPSYSVTFGLGELTGGPFTMLHEAGHNMGAVQGTAPHTSGAGHCIDGNDVMCYPDGGPFAHRYSSDNCSITQYDCGHDDYFHPAPTAENYLFNHWNVASTFNRFVGGCAYRTGVLQVGTGGVAVDDVSARTHSIPKSCWGARFALSGTVVRPEVASGSSNLERTLGTVGFFLNLLAPAQPVPDFNVCFYKRSTSGTPIKCREAIGTDVGSIPEGTRKAQIVLKAGVDGTYVFNAV